MTKRICHRPFVRINSRAILLAVLAATQFLNQILHQRRRTDKINIAHGISFGVLRV